MLYEAVEILIEDGLIPDKSEEEIEEIARVLRAQLEYVNDLV